MSTTPFPLSNVVDVVVQVSPLFPPTPSFNQGLIIGSSPVIPSVGGTNPRIRQYTSKSAMISDGFTDTQPEYLAVQTAFNQVPPPQFVWVGRQDLTAIGTMAIAVGGTGWAVNDKFLVVQSGASLGQGVVLTESAGVATSIGIVEGFQGTGYTAGSGLATTPLGGSAGNGLTVNITGVGETPTQAAEACRIASNEWYMFAVLGLEADDTNNQAVALWAQSAVPVCVYSFISNTSAAIVTPNTSIFALLNQASINRAIGIYSTDQGGTQLNNVYAQCAVLGVAMGLNTGLPNSCFTLKFKKLVSITPEPITQTQATNIENNGGNVYLNYSPYAWMEPGQMTNLQKFREIIQLDMLAADIQFSLVDVLTSEPEVAQNDPAQSQLLATVDGCNDRSAIRGFINSAGGIWNGPTLTLSTKGPTLANGAALPNGYINMSAPYVTQSPADHDAGKSMPIIDALLTSGEVDSIVVGVYVQR